jgi:hypothetical protein
MSKEPDRRYVSRPCSSSYPAWVCVDCGKEYGHKLPGEGTTWHHGVCGVCGEDDIVTEPRDFGHLKEGWHLLALESIALQVVRSASVGDQYFIECLRGEDDETKRLRLAIVSLAELLRTAF